MRKADSHPEERSKVGKPTRDPSIGIEWKAKPSVNEKADFLRWKRNGSVEGRTGKSGLRVKWLSFSGRCR